MSVKNSQHAHSLTEMLVALMIISVLTALIFPIFSTVRERSRQSICQSNLRQLGMAIGLYVQDNDGRLPQAHSSTRPGEGTFANDALFLVQDLNPYLGRPSSSYKWGQLYPNPNSVWKCPGDIPSDGIGYEGRYHGTSYTYQWQYGGKRLVAPLTSGYEGWYPNWEWILRPCALSEAALLWDYSLNHDHATRRNVLFADTHIEYVDANWKQPLKYQ